MMKNRNESVYINRLDVVETYANSLGVIQFDRDGLYIEFCMTRLEEAGPGQPPKASRYPTCRLMLSHDVSSEFIEKLTRMAISIRQRNALNKAPVPEKNRAN